MTETLPPTDMPAKLIQLRVSVAGGRVLTAKNAHRITARSTRASDRMGNALDKLGKSPIFRLRDEPPYFQRWVIKKEKEGFIFREVQSNSGICGHAPTVRKLVIKSLSGFSALLGGHIVVEVTP